MDTKTLEKAQQLISMIKRYEELINYSIHPDSKLTFYAGSYYKNLNLPKDIEKKLLNDVVNAWKEEKRLLEKEFNSL